MGTIQRHLPGPPGSQPIHRIYRAPREGEGGPAAVPNQAGPRPEGRGLAQQSMVMRPKPQRKGLASQGDPRGGKTPHPRTKTQEEPTRRSPPNRKCRSHRRSLEERTKEIGIHEGLTGSQKSQCSRSKRDRQPDGTAVIQEKIPNRGLRPKRIANHRFQLKVDKIQQSEEQDQVPQKDKDPIQVSTKIGKPKSSSLSRKSQENQEPIEVTTKSAQSTG